MKISAKTLLVGLTLITLNACSNSPTPQNDLASKPFESNKKDLETGEIGLSVENEPDYNLYFVAYEGQKVPEGSESQTIGCNDTLIAVGRTSEFLLSNNQAKMEAAFKDLISQKDQTYLDTGLNNTLADSNLTMDYVAIIDGKAEVKLSGQLKLGGTCDAPRVESQLTQTALQFPGITEVTIFINNQALQDYLSQE